jgi:uncharacterized protein
MVQKPSGKEEDFFAREEYERRKRTLEEQQQKLAEDEKQRLRDLHLMKCPKCGMDLVEIDYRTIKIDKCSACEGIWLDAGELEEVSKLEKPGLDKLFNFFRK